MSTKRTNAILSLSVFSPWINDPALPTFQHVTDEVTQKLQSDGRAPVKRDREGIPVKPMHYTLPGLMFIDERTDAWAYHEERDGKMIPIVQSSGWRELMYRQQPMICDPVAYHVGIVMDRVLELQFAKSQTNEQVPA